MGTEERKYSKSYVLELLNDLYPLIEGKHTKHDEMYTFAGKITKKEVARQLGYSEQTLGQILKTPEDEYGKSYENFVILLKKEKRVRLLEKENGTLKIQSDEANIVEYGQVPRILDTQNNVKKSGDETKNFPHKWAYSFLILLIALLIFSVIQSPRKRKSNKEITDISEITNIFDAHGQKTLEVIVTRATEVAMESFQKVQSTGMPLSDEEKIAIMSDAVDLLVTELGSEREQIRRLGYTVSPNVQSDKNIVDLVNHVLPLTDALNSRGNELIYDELPENAGMYDRKLWELRGLLFGELDFGSEESLAERIKNGIESERKTLRVMYGINFKYFKENATFISKDSLQKRMNPD